MSQFTFINKIDKLIWGKKSFIMNKYTDKHKRIHVYKDREKKYIFLQIFDTGVFSYLSSASSVNQFLPYACNCEDAHVNQTKFNYDSVL